MHPNGSWIKLVEKLVLLFKGVQYYNTFGTVDLSFLMESKMDMSFKDLVYPILQGKDKILVKRFSEALYLVEINIKKDELLRVRGIKTQPFTVGQVLRILDESVKSPKNSRVDLTGENFNIFLIKDKNGNDFLFVAKWLPVSKLWKFCEMKSCINLKGSSFFVLLMG